MEDDAIVQLFWDRDEKAITATAEKYGSYCMSIASNILGNSEDAEECVNDAYLNTWNSIPPHRPQMLSTYLGKIVRNLSFNMYKKKRADKRGGGQIGLVLEELSEVVEGHGSPEEAWDMAFLNQAINDFLGELPKEKRAMFVRRYWHADSVRDIAKRYGMTENNVAVTLNRIRGKLGKYLAERGIEL